MKRTQFGWVFLAVIIAILAFVAYQKQDTSTIIVLVAFSTILLFLFYKLTIKVTEEYVKFSLGIGLISGKYKLKSISQRARKAALPCLIKEIQFQVKTSAARLDCFVQI